MNRSRAFRLLFVLSGFVLCAPVYATVRFQAVVVHITSGDTLTLRRDGLLTRHRLAVVDAPELDQPYGRTAKKKLGGLLFKRRVLVEVVDEKSGLVLLEINGIRVAEWLLRRGLAWVVPEHAHDRRLSRLQYHSQNNRRGLWRTTGCVPPWLWRVGIRR